MSFFVALGTLGRQKDHTDSNTRGLYDLLGCTPGKAIIGLNSACCRAVSKTPFQDKFVMKMTRIFGLGAWINSF